LVRFGQSHLFRGYDNARGISNLGNFIAEFAVAEHRSTFHVAAFGAGGQMNVNGRRIDADQRKDEPGLGVLASHARFEATVFDMRPLRPLLHRIDPVKRTAAQRNLTEWADGYDALICYRNVTPLTVGVSLGGSSRNCSHPGHLQRVSAQHRQNHVTCSEALAGLKEDSVDAPAHKR
jgi:hypothetical protein